MPTEDSGTQGQEPTATEGQEPTGDGQEPTGQQGTTGSDGSQEPQSQTPEGSVDALPEWAQQIVRDARSEAAKYRTQVREYEQAQLTEQERMQQRIADLEAENERLSHTARDTLVRSEVTSVASRLGVIDPEAAYRLIDVEQLSYDDDGNPTDVEAAVKELIQQRPYLAPNGSGDAGARRESSAQRDMNTILRRAAGRT